MILLRGRRGYSCGVCRKGSQRGRLGSVRGARDLRHRVTQQACCWVLPRLRGAAARRSSDVCMAHEPADIWWAHARSSVLWCALRAPCAAAVNSCLAAAAASTVYRCIVWSTPRRPQAETQKLVACVLCDRWMHYGCGVPVNCSCEGWRRAAPAITWTSTTCT